MANPNALIPASLVGDIKRGGWRITVNSQADTAAIATGQGFEILAKSGANFYDTAFRQVFNGNAIAALDNIGFDRYNSQSNVVCGTANEFLSGEAVQDIGFTSQATPLNDHQITNLSLALIVDHIMRRHCNIVFDAVNMPDGIVTVMNIDFANSVQLQRYNTSKSQNMWRVIQNIGGGESSGEFYRAWFDKNNSFYYQPSPMFGTKTSLGTIDKTYIWNKPRVRLNANQPGKRVGQTNITAIKNFNELFVSKYPSAPADGKTLPSKDGIFAASQGESDLFAERMYKWLTRPYTVTVQVDPALVAFEVDLADKITLSYNGPVDGAGSGMHLDLSGDYFIFGASIQFDSSGKFATGSLTLESDNS